MPNSIEDASDWLRRAYEVRRLKNPFYSQRAFAKHLGLSSGRLSEILLKRRLMTLNQVENLSRRLKLNSQEMNALRETVKLQKTGRLNAKTTRALLLKDSTPGDYAPVSEDSFFAAFADWYHLAILNLLKTKDFKSNPSWIADRLGIKTKEAAEALNRLKRLGLIQKKGNRWIRSVSKIRTTTDIPSSAIKLHHKQQLNLAIQALDKIPVELRDISSMTLAIDMERLGEAKEMIKNFRRTLSDFLEKENRTQVYHLTISLCPLSLNLPPKESML